jgi:hypothetical protein
VLPIYVKTSLPDQPKSLDAYNIISKRQEIANYFFNDEKSVDRHNFCRYLGCLSEEEKNVSFFWSFFIKGWGHY